MVQAIGNDRVLLAHQRLEHAAVGVETGSEYDRIVLTEVPGDRAFEFAMQRLRPADEAHRRHAEAECVHRALCSGDHLGMIGEAEIIVGAEVEHRSLARVRGDADASALRPGEETLALGEPGRVDLVERRSDMTKECVRH